jgi:outer membrane receptor for ferrienterochelin and colicins
MNRGWLVVLMSAVIATRAFPADTSATPVAAAPPDPEMAGLMAVLAEETAVATKTRMNSDSVPGLVTVLHGDEMLALGAETVWDALAFVPGLYTVRDRFGTPSVIVRGTEFPFNSGNVKVLINGIALSRENAGINGILLQVPIQQVERIEVIRGPGSVVYGDFAFMGLVNVITRDKGSQIYARYGADGALSGGGQVAAKLGGFEVGAAAAGLTNDDAPFGAPVVGDDDRTWGSAFARRGGFSVVGERITRSSTAGNPGTTPGPNDQEHWGVEVRQGHDVRPALRLEARAGFKHNRFTTVNLFDGDQEDLGLDVHWRPARHTWLAGIAYSHGHIDSAAARIIVPGPPTDQPPAYKTVSDQSRDVVSAALQDRFDVSDAVSFTAGARFDHYSDLGKSRLTPRASVVWRVSDKNILKLQHAEGFRAPTYFELYSTGPATTGPANPNLDFEVNGTTELNYVHRRPRMVARATLFRSRLRDMTFVAAGGLFASVKSGSADGLELEWEQQVHGKLKAQSNFSWVDQQDNRNPDQVSRRSPAGAKWLGNVGLLFQPTRHSMLTTHWNHVDRPSDTLDARGYDLIDAAATWRDVPAAGLQLRGGIKNVFDRDVRYIVVRPDATTDAFHYPRRTFWVQLAFSR